MPPETTAPAAAAAVKAAPTVVATNSLIDMYDKMGTPARLVVYILLIMAIYLIAVTIERWWFFRRNKKSSRALVIAMRDMMSKKGALSIGMLSEITQNYKNVALARVVEAASIAFSKKTEGVDALDVIVGINRAVERTIERQTSLLKRGFGGLATIASTAPFVGLFGTVLGIISAFIEIQHNKGAGGMETVSGGIAEALVTTAFGLLVAIPAVAIYNYFNGVVDKIVVDMDEVASEMVEAVVFRDKKV
jgi:biopolymer transport protein ExbB/TolQ